MIHSPLVLAKPNSGTEIEPPSMSGPRPEIPTTPPQERRPTRGPSRASRNIAGKMSPSEPANSSRRATLGPMKTPSGYVVPRLSVREYPRASHGRARRSMIILETLPPPFALPSTTSPSLSSWP
jgi:hypothetical protein